MRTDTFRGVAPTAFGLPRALSELVFSTGVEKTWRHRLCRFYAAIVPWRSNAFFRRGVAPTAFGLPRALSKLDFSTGVEKSWRHRLRRFYAATVSRRSLLLRGLVFGWMDRSLALRPSASATPMVIRRLYCEIVSLRLPLWGILTYTPHLVR